MYVDMNQPQDVSPAVATQSASPLGRIQYWINQNLALVILLGLAILSILLVLSQ